MNKTAFKLSLFILVAISSVSKAQDIAGTHKISKSNSTLNSFDEVPAIKEKRTGTLYKNNISAHLGLFDPWLGVSYERLITPFWGFDAALGLIGGSIGTKVYFPRLGNGKTSVYTGISEGVLLMVGQSIIFRSE